MAATLSESQLRLVRRLRLNDGVIRVSEAVENLAATDRPVAWTEHVTLGPPFLENGVTEFRASATRSKVLETTFGSADYLTAAAVFDWPHAPRRGSASPPSEQDGAGNGSGPMWVAVELPSTANFC